MNKWCIDVSKYNPLSMDQLAELVRHEMTGMIIRSSNSLAIDPMVDDHVANCRQAGIPYGLYHWVDPILDCTKQAQLFVDQIIGYGARFAVMDMEQYWMNWDEWYAVTVSHQGGHIRAFSQEQLYRKYYEFFTELRRILSKNIPIVGYSSRWFVDGYCRRLASILKDCHYYWNARYVSWLQLDKNPQVTWEEFNQTVSRIEMPKDSLPAGITKWDIWQFAILPMKGFPRLDCDIIKDEAAAVLFGDQPIVPPEPVDPPEPVFSERMLMRVTQDVGVYSAPRKDEKLLVGDLQEGNVVEVLNIAGGNAWIEFKPGQYAPVQVGLTRFMKPLETEEE